ncbi:hypothetical protein HDU88_008746 [Geranomyces variabilis]|nr:hypothetical protein HDU88_008746 [Geranomyces variabilis]
MISADKTHLTTAAGCSNTSHPVYLTLANIPADLRNKMDTESFRMIAHLPAMPDATEKEKKTQAYCNAKAALYHEAFRLMFQPLKDAAAAKGIIMSGPTKQYLAVPVLWSVLADYEEMTTIMGNFAWDWPFTDVYDARVPDILHELSTGIWANHLLNWIYEFVADHGPNDGAALLDFRFKHLPRYPGLTAWPKGVQTLTNVTGDDYKSIMKHIVGILHNFSMSRKVLFWNAQTEAGLAMTSSADLLAKALECVENFVNFFYLVTSRSIAESSIPYIEDALRGFWKSREVFQNYSASEFNFPKMHALTKYVDSLRKNGSATNYTTEHSEHRHVKDLKTLWQVTNRHHAQAQVLRQHGHRLALRETRRSTEPCNNERNVRNEKLEALMHDHGRTHPATIYAKCGRDINAVAQMLPIACSNLRTGTAAVPKDAEGKEGNASSHKRPGAEINYAGTS